MQIDFYEHYKKKGTLKLDKESFRDDLAIDEPYIKLVKKYLNNSGRILECGCGPARTALSLAFNGFQVTAVDYNDKILGVAKENAINLGLDDKIIFILMDFFNIEREFEKNSFDCITHQGVIEHYNEEEIKRILKLQINIAPLIIFSVPIKTEFNAKEYFKDSMYRNLWTEKYWLEDVLKDFYVMDFKVVRQRSDNLIVVIEKFSKEVIEQIRESESNKNKGKFKEFIY